ncbi:VOC family protein [Acidobacteria bacterium AH-259-A15]|nr:VOC family protein [Acidobacteria bacterium AH-259-A15]
MTKMTNSGCGNLFRVEQVDHIEVFVPNRYEAAEWYEKVLGLEIVLSYEQWAEDSRGPLMISSDNGNTKLALFEGQPQGSRETAGFHRVAFRVDAASFFEFVKRLADLHLKDHRGRLVTSQAVVDHQKAYSIYFCDPYGHRLEVTTYDYDEIKRALQSRATENMRL